MSWGKVGRRPATMAFSKDSNDTASVNSYGYLPINISARTMPNENLVKRRTERNRESTEERERESGKRFDRERESATHTHTHTHTHTQ